MNVVSASSCRGAAPLGGLRVSPLAVTLALTAVALLVRSMGLGTRPLWLDEAYSAWFSSRDWTYLWTVVPTYETHPPFYYSLLKLWRALFGGTAVELRVPSLLFGTLTVPVVVMASAELERLNPTKRPLLSAGAPLFSDPMHHHSR